MSRLRKTPNKALPQQSGGPPLRGPFFCLLLALLGLLSGCGGEPDAALLEDYLARLARTLDSEAPAARAVELPRWPRTRALPPAAAPIRLSSAQTLALMRCGMTNALAAENTTLARVQASSQRLRQAHDTLAALRTCADGEALSAAQRAEILPLLDAKAEQRRRHLFHATLGSAEFRGLLRTGRARSREIDAGLQALEALRGLALASAPGLRPPPPADWEPQLRALDVSQAGGALLARQRRLIQALEQANTLLAPAVDSLCRAGHQPPRARVLRRVFEKFYLGGVQPLWAETNRAKRRFATALADLLAVNAAVLEGEAGAGVRRYVAAALAADSPLDTALAQVAGRHVRLWQRALESCGWRPGVPASG